MNVDLFCVVFGFASGLTAGWALWCGAPALADHSVPPDVAEELERLRALHGAAEGGSDG